MIIPLQTLNEEIESLTENLKTASREEAVLLVAAIARYKEMREKRLKEMEKNNDGNSDSTTTRKDSLDWHNNNT